MTHFSKITNVTLREIIKRNTNRTTISGEIIRVRCHQINTGWSGPTIVSHDRIFLIFERELKDHTGTQ